MRQEDLLLFLQDIVEEDGDLTTLKYRYSTYGDGKYDLSILKAIVIYGIKKQLLEVSKYIRKNSIEESYYEDFDVEKSIEIIKDDDSWEKIEINEYSLCFKDTPHYFFILFGPYGPVGEHAMEGARIPEEFEQFIIGE